MGSCNQSKVHIGNQLEMETGNIDIGEYMRSSGGSV